MPSPRAVRVDFALAIPRAPSQTPSFGLGIEIGPAVRCIEFARRVESGNHVREVKGAACWVTDPKLLGKERSRQGISPAR